MNYDEALYQTYLKRSIHRYYGSEVTSDLGVSHVRRDVRYAEIRDQNPRESFDNCNIYYG